MFSQPHKPQGFTLIELLLVLAIAGIMAAIAYPTMSDWLAYRRVATKSEQLINMLRLARAESVRLNLPVYVCPVDIADTGYIYRNRQCFGKYFVIKLLALYCRKLLGIIKSADKYLLR